MTVGDAITICLILLALWTFIPRVFRRAIRDGLEPTVIALAGAVRTYSRHAAHIIMDLAYKVLIGQPRPQSVKRFAQTIDHSVKPEAPRTEASVERSTSVRPDTYQPASVEAPENEVVLNRAHIDINAHMPKTELITLLAVQKTATGEYVYSANKILALVGGTAADVMAQIAAIRNPPKPTPEPAQGERGKSLRRPAEGW